MSSQAFPYLAHSNPKANDIRKNWYKLPLLPTTIRHEGKAVSYLALVDSGADFNVFHSDIARILEIDLTRLKNKVEFGGVKEDNKPCIGYLAMVDLEIGNETFASAIVFSDDISDDGYGILGQSGFFTNFEVRFDRTKYMFYLAKK